MRNILYYVHDYSFKIEFEQGNARLNFNEKSDTTFLACIMDSLYVSWISESNIRTSWYAALCLMNYELRGNMALN